MKRVVCLVLVAILMSSNYAFASDIQYSDSVRIVRNAYNKALNSNADGDAAYNEIYNVIVDLKSALLMNNSKEIGYAQVKLFGWEDKSTNSELMAKAFALSEFIVAPDEDKLSALMCKFATMKSVKGTIEPTYVDIQVTNMETFVKELGLTPKATGYVLAMLDIYFYNGEAVLFSETGFDFYWKAIGTYKMDLSSIKNKSTAIKVTKQPSHATGEIGTVVKTTVEATGNGLTYTWYIKNPSSNKFGKSSVTSKTYSFKMTKESSGRQVYCVITDAKGNSVTTKTVTLSIPK